jgi:hypothetical protein
VKKQQKAANVFYENSGWRASGGVCSPWQPYTIRVCGGWMSKGAPLRKHPSLK